MCFRPAAVTVDANINCRKCGESNPPTAITCKKCGEQLSSGLTPASVPGVPSAPTAPSAPKAPAAPTIPPRGPIS